METKKRKTRLVMNAAELDFANKYLNSVADYLKAHRPAKIAEMLNAVMLSVGMRHEWDARALARLLEKAGLEYKANQKPQPESHSVGSNGSPQLEAVQAELIKTQSEIIGAQAESIEAMQQSATVVKELGALNRKFDELTIANRQLEDDNLELMAQLENAQKGDQS